jgi:hypothetical protein
VKYPKMCMMCCPSPGSESWGTRQEDGIGKLTKKTVENSKLNFSTGYKQDKHIIITTAKKILNLEVSYRKRHCSI